MDWSRTRIVVVGPPEGAAAASAECFLSAQGAQVDWVHDLADALILLSRSANRYSALVFSAGDFQGEELGPLRAVRQLHPETALVACVGAGERRRGLEALRVGADACLPEPFYRGELVALIERLVSRVGEGGAPAAAASEAVPTPAAASTVAETVEAEGPVTSVVEAGPGAEPALTVLAEPPPAPEAAPASGTTPEAPPALTLPREGAGEREVRESGPAGREVPPSPAAEVVPGGREIQAAERPAQIAGPSPSTGALPHPRAGEPHIAEATGAPAEELAAPAGAAGRVLLVNDERHFRELLADILRQRGFYVADADDEKQALWCLADADYDAIVVDARTNGAGQALRSLGQAAPETPVVVVTSLAGREEEEAFRRAGAAACLEKPFDIEQLVQVLRGVMRRPARLSHPILTPEEVDALLAPHPEWTGGDDPGRDGGRRS